VLAVKPQSGSGSGGRSSWPHGRTQALDPEGERQFREGGLGQGRLW